ncbi:hypothetical protein [Nakamurella leprariae]|uniref:Uncharacterized protein n=1 Tax=Nakamurella leprariae TaxID=2803911 RepID=A0A938YEB6_9ACTN|nr:hypothetical protein [Nakamurella leprariae]MBM9467991.1 hypothetical protein [Nakamurella leprariae]
MTVGESVGHSDGAYPKVDSAPSVADQHEYDSASLEWFFNRVHALAREMNPLLGQLAVQTFERMPEMVTQLEGGEELVNVSSSVGADMVISVHELIDGDLDQVHARVYEFAERYEEQLMKAFIATVGDAAERAGNVVEASQPGLAGLIDAIEKTELNFDEDGRLTTQLLLHPDTAEKLRQQESESPELARRMNELIDRKRVEYFASRRARRLPRHRN